MIPLMKHFTAVALAVVLTLALSSCAQEATLSTPQGSSIDNPSTPQEAITRLSEQNAAYVMSATNTGDISSTLREETVTYGQSPYAVVLTCSDSRVVPEHIFMEGIGALFTIRNAGNIVDDTVLGSIEYGGEHLGAQVVVVLGHTNCGAVSATLAGGAHGYIATITDTIAQGIDGETDPTAAEVANVHTSMDAIMESSVIAEMVEEGSLAVVGAIYDSQTGAVTFLDYQPQATTTDVNTLYQQAVDDAAVAEEDEISSLVTLTPQDEMTTWNDEGEVLLLTWNKYPDSYQEGDTVTLSYGSVWTFTDKEMLAWYEDNHGTIEDVQLRLNQLIGLPPEDDNTHITALWVNPSDILRPAYNSDITTNTMVVDYPQDMDDAHRAWFDGNAATSYDGDNPYPWTRLGYTYDWADNGTEYGLSEFLVVMGSQAEVAYTMTTAEFLSYMDSQL